MVRSLWFAAHLVLRECFAKRERVRVEGGDCEPLESELARPVPGAWREPRRFSIKDSNHHKVGYLLTKLKKRDTKNAMKWCHVKVRGITEPAPISRIFLAGSAAEAMASRAAGEGVANA